MHGWRSRWELLVQDTAPSGLLNALHDAGVEFFCAVPADAVALRLDVAYEDIGKVRSVLDSRGSDLRVCRPQGMIPRVLQLLRRRALIACAAVCMVILAVSNLFVWRIDVEGNAEVPKGAVLRAMESVGAGFGSFWPGLDGEQLKTDLLVQLEQVQWVGISYNTGVLRVVVREQREIPEVVDNDEAMHIVAVRDGIITEISSKQGQCLVGEGDTVETGQVLITGAVQSPIGTMRGVHAIGTVQARTWHTISARQASTVTGKQYTGRKSWKFALNLGENRINFFPGSSISEETCDKIIMDYHLCMEGVFSLPIHLTMERREYWAPVTRQLSPEEQRRLAEHTLVETLEQRLGENGKTVTVDVAAANRAEGTTVTLAAECLENIGKETPLTAEELRQIELNNTLGEETTND